MDAPQDHPFVEAIARVIDAQGLLTPRASVLVAVSGGADSVALAVALAALRDDPALDYRLGLAHLDHVLRGEEGEADARFVGDLAARLGLPLTAERRPVRAEQGGSVEAAARRVRYEFLAEVARRTCADVVAVGHTRDDQVETVLLRLVRGASLSDLTGMSPSRPLTAGSEVRLVRPLLEASRRDVLAFLDDVQAPHREDPSNRDVRFTRNRIRQELLPLLEADYNPDVRGALLAVSAAAAQHRQRLDRAAEQLLADAQVMCEEGEVRFPVTLLERAHRDLREELLRRVAARLSDEPAISRADLSRAEQLLRARGSSKWVPLGNDLCARRIYDVIVVERRGRDAPGASVPGASADAVTLSPIGATRLPPWNIRMQVTALAGAPPQRDAGPNAATLDADRLAGELFVRGRRPGDRFRPLGAPGHRKLKDFLIDRKVPAHDRDRIPLVCDAAGIVWVVGHAIEDRVKITGATRRALLLVAHPLDHGAP